MSTPLLVTTTPALVIAVGKMARQAAAEIEAIFLRSDLRRAVTTRFLALQEQPDGFHLMPCLDDNSLPSSGQAIAVPANLPEAGRPVFERLLASFPALKGELESTLHELRAHEGLIEVGLGEKSILPLDVFLLADLAERDSSHLFPLALLLQSLLGNEPHGSGFLILSVASFGDAEETSLAEARRQMRLEYLASLLRPQENPIRKQGCAWLGLAEASPLPFQVYLLDRYKEGAWEVKDGDELRLLMGNLLLAMLSGGLAQHLADKAPLADRLEGQAHFSSAAATVLVFDPVALIETCAARLGADMLFVEFGEQIAADPRRAEAISIEMEGQLRTCRAWLEAGCAGTPWLPSTQPLYQVDADGLNLAVHFAELRFEDLPPERWEAVIREYDHFYGEKSFPEHRAVMQSNVQQLADEETGVLSGLLDALPQNAALYPGGLNASRLVIERLKEAFKKRQETFSASDEAMDQYPARLEACLQSLEQAVKNLPRPPRWMKVLPAPLAGLARHIFNLLFLRREHQNLILLREACVHALEQEYAHQMNHGLSQSLAQVCQSILGVLEKNDAGLIRLQKGLEKVRKRLTARGTQAWQPESLFRVDAADEAVVEWAYSQGQQPLTEARFTLLQEQRFLEGWQKINIKTLEARLLAFCRQAFQPLYQITLEEALRHRQEADTASLLAAMSQGAAPLLRPDFDRGGGHRSFQTCHFLCADPHASTLAALLRSGQREWEFMATADPYLAICCRARHLIPVSALEELTRRGRAALASLDAEQKQALDLEMAPLPGSS